MLPVLEQLPTLILNLIETNNQFVATTTDQVNVNPSLLNKSRLEQAGSPFLMSRARI